MAMASPRPQRLVFGEDAELYDRARPPYPDALVDDVLGWCPPGRDWQALEVGAGTGKATVAFARHHVRIVALEPDTAMAAVAARRVAGSSEVTWVASGLEEWDPGAARFALVYSAQAWHWVRPEVRNAKAAALLDPGGVLALFWHRTAWPPDDPARDALDDLYRRWSPTLHSRPLGFPGFTPPGYDAEMHDEVAASGHFADVTVRRYPWRRRYDAEAYVSLLATQSDHRLLPEAERRALLQAVGDYVTGAGGLDVPYETYLVLGRRAP